VEVGIMNKKCQEGGTISIFSIVFISIIFILVLSMGLGGFITTMIGLTVDFGGLVGVEAFLVSGLLLFIILAFFIAMLWVTRT
jgi:hypothetical protein